MPSEDQERVEDYLELQRYIEQLQAGEVARLPENVTPEQARVYRMAALFRSTTPQAEEDATPQLAFLEQLQARLLSQLHSPMQSTDASPAQTEEAQGEKTTSRQEQYPSTPTRTKVAGQRSLLSRRNLLTGVATAAASLGIGVGVGYTVERVGSAESAGKTGDTKTATSFTWDPETPLVGSVPKTWLHVASLAQLSEGAVRFVTDALVGYAVYLTKEQGYAEDEVIALSAACTHMGCLVQWQNTDHRFHCPCHSGLFEASGEQVNQPDYAYTLAPLPRLSTRVENGDVYVEVPAK